MKLLLFFVIILIAVSSSTTIECYNCLDQINGITKDCSNTFDATKVARCTGNYCFKTVGDYKNDSYSESITLRGCIASPILNVLENKLQKSVEMTQSSYVCDFDLCNGVSSNFNSITTILILSITSLIYSAT